MFSNSKVGLSSSLVSDKKSNNPFIKSPTKVFNLGEIISSNKLASPFNSNLGNIFLSNANNESKSLKSG